MKTLDVVVPVYNEELFKDKLEVNYIFINDGSKDKSAEIITNFANNDNSVKLIDFSRNFGHQMALSAGLDYSKSDYVAIIDADLQDPPELIYDMYEKSLEGYDVVYGKRLKRKAETIFKKLSAWGFYRLLKSMCKVEIPTDTGDFRFITADVRNAFNQMKEQHRFIRGMVPWIGFKSTPLYYNRDERFAGETKYPLSKMLKLAFDGIYSFSSKLSFGRIYIFLVDRKALIVQLFIPFIGALGQVFEVRIALRFHGFHFFVRPKFPNLHAV